MIDDAKLLEIVHWITRGFEMAGIAIIVAGSLWSAWRFARHLARADGTDGYRALRSNLGRSILLGLELMVAADIIDTVAVEPSLTSVAVLAGIVAIRTFLSLSLELEIEGRWPWQREVGG